MSSHIITWLITAFSIAGVIIRPFKLPEAICAVSGAVLLLVFKLILPLEAVTGIFKGTDVYLFLTGMMLLSETAREEKLFDWLAAKATNTTKGSPVKLFVLLYVVGIIVTIFLSNDATAVVLTPAVAAAVRSAKATKPLPYLLICAFIANAASFVLPVSNPANLVIYGRNMPPLFNWLSTFIVPSLFSIIITFLMLFLTQRKNLKQVIATNINVPSLTVGGRTAAFGIMFTAVILLLSSAFNMQLGLPTFIAGAFTSAIVLIRTKKSAVTIIKGISWSILPLVAGLFVMVEALNKTGLIHQLSFLLEHNTNNSVNRAAWSTGIISGFATNLVNNLPLGLFAGNTLQTAHSPGIIKSAVLIGVDLGPNLSVTGSLATILWLTALRREGEVINAWTFLKLGFIIMIPALIAAIAALWL